MLAFVNEVGYGRLYKTDNKCDYTDKEIQMETLDYTFERQILLEKQEQKCSSSSKMSPVTVLIGR